MWLVQAPEFQVLFPPARRGYELLQVLPWLSALEAPELCPDVSGKQDPPDTCEPQSSAADKLPPGRGGGAIPGDVELSFQTDFRAEGACSVPFLEQHPQFYKPQGAAAAIREH